MRPALAVLITLGAGALGGAQPRPGKEPTPEELVPRYGVNARAKAFPQDTPKAALKSALAAVEKADYSYLVAQLLDPKFTDAAVDERAKRFEPGAETELAQLRDFQRANRDKIAPEDRVPTDAGAFAAAVRARARDRGFRLLVRDVEQKLTDDPQTVKEFRRVARDGAFAEGEDAATATLPELGGRTLYFKKVGNRWFLENRQADVPKKEP
jgi:hypothetical protein